VHRDMGAQVLLSRRSDLYLAYFNNSRYHDLLHSIHLRQYLSHCMVMVVHGARPASKSSRSLPPPGEVQNIFPWVYLS